ncbi:DNA glycosylase AlkZ-like family protein [Archangium lansingense]|uniref:Winged helix DNA-binding domain-containing protein n=1 Tax=Archangium lansingense TaxID=2995310 RepID=A0ABT4AKP0_9BACT|nr:crosslink repair DNA glycosylase YcaQ family protein [Archangium lansinium]MCY1082136.1 winged helix DNA-binding domain-containing protein [Archangium lansinium]
MARSTITPALTVSLERVRAHWHRKQGLDEPIQASVEEVVAATGWLRTLGGVDAYLAMRARVPGMKRRQLDEAVEQSRLQVIPAVRGCIYLVPRPEVPLVLRIAEEQHRKRADREHEKAGIAPKELADVGEAVLKALRKGPLSTDALRKALPEGTVRSLGDKGKKVGISSTLPPALRHLEFEGKVERTLDGGRLDTERYLWRLPAKNPLTGAKVPAEAVERHARIAATFFRQAGPTTLESFTTWAALSQREARAAMEKLPLVPVAVEGLAAEAWVLEEELAVLREKVPVSSSLSMLAFEDSYLAFHGGPALFTDPKHHAREVPVWGTTKGSTLGDARYLFMRPLLDGDRLVGFWEYDVDAGAVVFGTFDKVAPKRRKAVEALAGEIATFLRDDVGRAHSFSLDSDDSLRERAALVKEM